MSNFDWSRLKNYGLWVSVAALILLILNTFGVKVVPEQYNAIVNSILGILVAAGILNDPTTVSRWFGDDHTDKKEITDGTENK